MILEQTVTQLYPLPKKNTKLVKKKLVRNM